MPNSFKIEDHEVTELWREIWLITNNTGGWEKTSPTFKAQRLKLFQGLLDDHRQLSIGLPEGDSTEIRRDEPKAEPASPSLTASSFVHDPKWYRPNAKSSWIPWAEDARSGRKRGTFSGGSPSGLVLHWTAGHRNGLKAGNELMRNTGMLYLIGDKDGNLAQSDPLSSWGYHAGKSSWRSYGSVSDNFVGVEMQAAGTLKMSAAGHYYSWFKKRIPKSEVITVKRRGNIRSGHYHKLTSAQFLLARRLCCWLYLNNPTRFQIANIVGHDEVSPGRKTDPGGALVDLNGKPLTMAQFRKIVTDDIKVIKSKI